MIDIIYPRWYEKLAYILREAREHVFIAVPFIKEDIARLIIRNLKSDVRLKAILRLYRREVEAGVVDPEAVLLLMERGEVRFARNLHAKVIVSMERLFSLQPLTLLKADY